MEFRDYGKKAGLPIYNKLRPRRKDARQTYKTGGIIVLVILAILFFLRSGGSSVKESKDTIHEKASVNLHDTDHELYVVDKEGVKKQESVNLQKEESPGPMRTPEEQYSELVEYYDLNDFSGNPYGASKGDVVLFLMPLRNAEHVLPMAFYNIMNLTYDHSLIDIAFLVSDCSPGDTTLETVFEYSVALQNGTLVDKLRKEEEDRRKANMKGTSNLYQNYMNPAYMENVRRAYEHPEKFHEGYTKPFRSISIYKKDFGQVIGQGFSDRHAVTVQGIRRKLMGRARNWLTSNALKAHHSWIYWRDVDIETCPGSVIQDLMKHDYDVMVPNVWRPLPIFLSSEASQPYDLNSWIESDAAIELAKTLDEDDVIVEGYAEYPTWRYHLAYGRDPNGNPDEVVDVDGVGGVSILAKAKIFRQGVHFPAFTFENHAETEAFGKMAKKMGLRVGGLPHYTVWHIYEPSEDDMNAIAKLERQNRRYRKTNA